jgi:hypothetical protein
MSKGSQRRKENLPNIYKNWPDIDWSNKDERRTGDDWCQITGIIILDPDGWDRTTDSFITEKIGFGEFLKRKMRSTCSHSKTSWRLTELYDVDQKNAKCEQCGAKYSWYHINRLVWDNDKLVCKDWCLNNKKQEQI